MPPLWLRVVQDRIPDVWAGCRSLPARGEDAAGPKECPASKARRCVSKLPDEPGRRPLHPYRAGQPRAPRTAPTRESGGVSMRLTEGDRPAFHTNRCGGGCILCRQRALKVELRIHRAVPHGMKCFAGAALRVRQWLVIRPRQSSATGCAPESPAAPALLQRTLPDLQSPNHDRSAALPKLHRDDSPADDGARMKKETLRAVASAPGRTREACTRSARRTLSAAWDKVPVRLAACPLHGGEDAHRRDGLPAAHPGFKSSARRRGNGFC